MEIIKPSYEILINLENTNQIYKSLEKIGRTCYKSEDKISDNSAPKFLKMITKRNHLAIIEHYNISVRFIHNRGFTHELVRHRLAAYAQESTRYCNYSKDKFGNELTFIEPYWWEEAVDITKRIYLKHIISAEQSYFGLLAHDMPPQATRGVLPIDVKTEIVITANLREWKHIFSLRTADSAHPDMIRIMRPLQKEFIKYMPEVFGE